MLEMWVPSQTEAMKTVLDGIAAFFNQDGGKSFLHVSMALGFMVMMVKFIQKPDFKQMIMWFLVVALLPLLLINSRSSVLIHNSTLPLDQKQVDNIPNGLAYPLWLSTSLSHVATKSLEDSMHVPNDFNYNNTGMVYGAKLFRELNTVQPNPELLNEWSRFMYMCVDPNVSVRHRYTYKDLFDAKDIMQFLKDNTVDGFNRVYIPDGNAATTEADYPRCLSALNILEKKFQADSEFNFKAMGAYNPISKIEDANEMKQHVGGLSGYFMHLSADSQKTMMQNLLINATKNGFRNIAANKNQTAAALNYSQTQNEMASTASWVSMGMFAQEYIPMFQTILLMLLACAFIPMVYVAMFPYSTFNILTKYVFGFIWVASWPIFFVFINFIMWSFMKYSLSGYTDIWGGITLSNIDATAALTSKYAALSGYFLIMVPFISRLVVLGAANTFGSLTTSLMSGISGNAGIGARGVATGDYNIGNTNTGIHNGNNYNFDKTDMDKRMLMGNQTQSDMFGGTETQNAMGRSFFDNRTSHLATQISETEAVQSGATEQANIHRQNAFAESQQASESWNNTFNDFKSVGDNERMQHARQASQGSNENNSVDWGYSTMAAASQRYSKDDIDAAVSGWNGEIGGEIKYNGGLIGKATSLVAGLDASVYAKGSKSWSSSDTTNNTSSISAEEQENIRKASNILMNATQSEIASAEKNFGIDQSHSVQSNLTQAQSHTENASREARLSEDYSQMAQYSQTSGASSSYNAIPQFENWLRDRVGEPQANEYLRNAEAQGTSEFKGWVQDYKHDVTEQFRQNYLANKDSLQQPMQSEIQQKAQENIQGKEGIQLAHQMSNATLHNAYEENKQNFNQRVNNEVGSHDIGANAVGNTLNQYGLSNNLSNTRFDGSNPSSFNQSVAIPPKMHINIDEQGNQLNTKVDALRSEIIENKKGVMQKVAEDNSPEAQSFRTENDIFLDKFQ